MTQRITIRLGDAAFDATPSAPGAAARMPDMLLAAEPGWLSPGRPFPARGLLLRLRAGEEEDATLQEAVGTLAGGGLLDLEAVLPEGAEPRASLEALALRLARAGLFPRHVAALPECGLGAPPSDAERPAEPSPDTIAEAVAAAFPEARVGLGMITNFGDLGRWPGAEAAGHYVTHGTSASAQAADDASVLETLDALPQVFADAQRIAKARGLRLGLVSIGMRATSSGAGLPAGLLAGPTGSRRATASLDLRQKGLMAAAYAIAACASAAQAGAEAIALAAPSGPFGVVGADGAARPVFHAVAALHAAADRVVRLDPLPGLRGLAWEEGAILANASLSPVTVLAPFASGAVLSQEALEATRDPSWLREAAEPLSDQVTLGPCECLFAGEAAPSPR